MKKVRYFIFSLILLFSMKNLAKANSIYSIDVTMVLDEEGNANVTEVWNMDVDRGTEVYKPMGRLGNSEISNFHVSENGFLYEYQDSWNINGTLFTKKNKNGVNISDGVFELCWGMGSYGRHTYTLTYDVSNVIYNVDDAQVLYWKFINDNMNPAPQQFSVTVKGFNNYEDTLPIWGYGYNGKVVVENGMIFMSNSENRDFYANEYVVLLVKYPLETFKTNNYISDYKTFADFLKIPGNDYNQKKSYNLKNIILIFTIVFLPILIALFIVFSSIHKLMAIKKVYRGKYITDMIDYKALNCFRDIPCEKNLFKAFFLANVYKLNWEEGNLIGAVLLKWLRIGKIEIIKQKKKQLFKEKEINVIILGSCTFNTDYEQELYDMLFDASKDGMLEEKKLKKWCSNQDNYYKLYFWGPKVKESVRDEYIRAGHIKIVESDTKHKRKDYKLDEFLYEEAKKLAGLKKYLTEFTLIDKKEPIDVMLWDEYLIFAQIFGIAKEVAEKIKILYPELIENNEFKFDYDNIEWITSVLSNCTSSSSSSDSGIFGGGGFSSGGGGGGSFGGGSGGGCR